jgi:hypothetical protein
MLSKKIAKIILLLLVAHTSYALIGIDPTLIAISAENNSHIITVSNPNDYKAYVSMETEAFVCKNKSFSCDGEERVPYKGIENNILFSMPKFILNPKQTKKIHISWNGDLPKQPLHIMYYGQDHSAKAVTTMPTKVSKDSKISLDLKIITRKIAHILAFKAGTTEKEPIISSVDNSLTVKNTGNALLIFKLSQPTCPKDNKKCKFSSGIETVQPNSNQKYAFDSEYTILVKYFYKNAWHNKIINNPT